MYINVVNRHQDKAITANIQSTSGTFTGKGKASIINSDSLTTPFTFDKQAQYVPVTKDIQLNNGKLSYTFPPHSFTQIEIAVDKK